MIIKTRPFSIFLLNHTHAAQRASICGAPSVQDQNITHERTEYDYLSPHARTYMAEPVRDDGGDDREDGGAGAHISYGSARAIVRACV